MVLDPDFVVLAAAREELIGLKSPPSYQERLRRCLEGEILVTPPFPSTAMLADDAGNMRVAVPTMFAAAPVRAADGKVISALGPADCAGVGLHSHPGYRAGRRERRDICVQPDGTVAVSEPV